MCLSHGCLSLWFHRVVYYYGKDRVNVRELLTRWRKRVALCAADDGRSSSGSKARTKMPPGYVQPGIDGKSGLVKIRDMKDSDEKAAGMEETLIGYKVGLSLEALNACSILWIGPGAGDCRAVFPVWMIVLPMCFEFNLHALWMKSTTKCVMQYAIQALKWSRVWYGWHVEDCMGDPGGLG